MQVIRAVWLHLKCLEKKKNRTVLSPEVPVEEALYDFTNTNGTASAGEKTTEEETYNKLSHGDQNISNFSNEEATYNHISPENAYNTIPQNLQPSEDEEDTYNQLSRDVERKQEKLKVTTILGARLCIVELSQGEIKGFLYIYIVRYVCKLSLHDIITSL